MSSGEIGIFLDRDGTIIKDSGYVSNPDQVSLLPGSKRAMAILSRLNARIIIVTNQAGIAKGLYTVSDFNRVNMRMRNLLGGRSRFDAIYFCPHLVGGKIRRYAIECNCRKPATGLLEKAATAHKINLERSFIVGDKMRDVAAGWRLGLKTVLVLSGMTKRGDLRRKLPLSFDEKILQMASRTKVPEDQIMGPVDLVAKNLLEAAKWIGDQLKS